MISIYTTKDNLRAIVLDSNQVWYKIIAKLGRVYINDSIDDNADPDEDVLLTLDAMQYVNTSEAKYINSIASNPQSVLQHPDGIFLLDVTPYEAKVIQDDYGVLCQSINKMDYKPLTQINNPTELVNGESNHSWDDLISSRYKLLPSNSVLIIDAYIFANDKYDNTKKCYDSNYSNGINNVCDILNSILPNTFKGDYHIGILLTEKASSCQDLTNDRIANAINKLKKKLKKSYNINIEVIFFNAADSVGHSFIHNRRIISNYFIVTADYKLAALKNGKSVCDQSIVVWSLFENIDRDTDSDKKEKRIRIDLKKLQEYLYGTNPQAIHYKNGQIQQDFKTLEHRLLTK